MQETIAKYIDWQKSYVNGNQNSEFNPAIGASLEVSRMFYWHRDRVYNELKPFVDRLISMGVEEAVLYGPDGVIETLIPYQRRYNLFMNKVEQLVDRLCSPVLCVEDGSIDVDELSEEGLAPGKILVYRQGGKIPEMLGGVTAQDIECAEQLAKDAKAELYSRMEEIENAIELKYLSVVK